MRMFIYKYLDTGSHVLSRVRGYGGPPRQRAAWGSRWWWVSSTRTARPFCNQQQKFAIAKQSSQANPSPFSDDGEHCTELRQHSFTATIPTPAVFWNNSNRLARQHRTVNLNVNPLFSGLWTEQREDSLAPRILPPAAITFVSGPWTCCSD